MLSIIFFLARGLLDFVEKDSLAHWLLSDDIVFQWHEEEGGGLEAAIASNLNWRLQSYPLCPEHCWWASLSS